MSPITTHVLDSASGKPAAGIAVNLAYQNAAGEWEFLAEGSTDADGRVRNLLPEDHALKPGLYSLRFHTSGCSAFFPEVVLRFRVDNVEQHYHVPLLISPFAFTTYRGS